MNKSDSLQQLIQIIHEQNAEYIAIFGLIVTIAGIFLGFTGYQQKKISDKQVAKFTEEIKKAQSLVSSLREGNAAVVQYSLENMAIDDKFQAHPTWKQKARMFIAVKKMLNDQILDENKLQNDIKNAKDAVLRAAEQEFRSMCIDFCKDSMPIVNEGFRDSNNLIIFNRDSVFKASTDIVVLENQKKWLDEYYKLCKFVDDETLD